MIDANDPKPKRHGGRKAMPDAERPVSFSIRLLPATVAWLKANPDHLAMAKDILNGLPSKEKA